MSKSRTYQGADVVASDDAAAASTGTEVADAINGLKATVNDVVQEVMPDVNFSSSDFVPTDSNLLGVDRILTAIEAKSHPDYYDWDGEFVWADVSGSEGQITLSGMLPGRYYENDEAEGFIIPPTIGVVPLDFVISPGDYFEMEYTVVADNPSPVASTPIYPDIGVGLLIFDGDFSEAKLPLWQALNSGNAETWYNIAEQNEMSYRAAFIEAQGGFPVQSQLTVNVTATHVAQDGEINSGKFIGINAGVIRYGIEYTTDNKLYLHLFKDGALVRDHMSRDKSILLETDGSPMKMMVVGESYPNLDLDGGFNGQNIPSPSSKIIIIDSSPDLPVTVEQGVSIIGSRSSIDHPKSINTLKRSSARPTASEIEAGYSDGPRVWTVQDVKAVCESVVAAQGA